MADRHPYATSPGSLTQTITQFRKSFPSSVDAKTLKKLGLAPNNESYIISILRFLSLIDEDGNKTPAATKAFSLHEDSGFEKEFGAIVKSAYSDLFDLHQDATWKLDQDALIAFFRANDETTDVVGKKQASTFSVLAAFSGHGEISKRKTPAQKNGKEGPKVTATRRTTPGKSKSAGVAATVVTPVENPDTNSQVALTVRIEVNLPADGTQATYDRIFKSIRENLING